MVGPAGIVGLVLAGGRSSRMMGRDKAFAVLGGQPLVARACRRMAQAVPGEVAVSSNADPARLAGLGRPVLRDAFPDRPGPLAGIHAGLRWAEGIGARRLFTAAVDTPFLPLDAPARLAGAADEDTIAVSATEGRRHPTLALWPVSLAGALEAHLASGGSRRVNDFIDAHPHLGVEFAASGPDAPDPFFNVNTPADLAEAERMLAELVP